MSPSHRFSNGTVLTLIALAAVVACAVGVALDNSASGGRNEDAVSLADYLKAM
jgi:hypothetical protein